MSELVIVESPAKSKTIEKYLGSDYHVVSSKGHIRDLATTGKYGLGIDIENGFQPNYVAIKGKGKEIARGHAVHQEKVWKKCRAEGQKPGRRRHSHGTKWANWRA